MHQWKITLVVIKIDVYDSIFISIRYLWILKIKNLGKIYSKTKTKEKNRRFETFQRPPNFCFWSEINLKVFLWNYRLKNRLKCENVDSKSTTTFKWKHSSHFRTEDWSPVDHQHCCQTKVEKKYCQSFRPVVGSGPQRGDLLLPPGRSKSRTASRFVTVSPRNSCCRF